MVGDLFVERQMKTVFIVLLILVLIGLCLLELCRFIADSFDEAVDDFEQPYAPGREDE
jgi:hypothetical protein